MARTEPQINIRIPAELKRRLEDIAKANKRSVTAELLARLESTFDDEPLASRAETTDGRKASADTASKARIRAGEVPYVQRDEIQQILRDLTKTVGKELCQELGRFLDQYERPSPFRLDGVRGKKSAGKKA